MALYIGLISGTSMDGIDAALLETGEEGFNLAGACTHAIPRRIRDDLATLITSRRPSASLAWQLDRSLGEVFAEAALSLLEKQGRRAAEVSAIGSHGQTVAHHPAGGGYSVQIGDPNVIAERTGITTVADFRRRDLAAGGEGAPLACAFHRAAMSLPDRERSVVNVGGIANLSVLSPGGEVVGFDTGPGNTLMDLWAQRHLGACMDRDGAWADSGTVDDALLARLHADPYFEKTPPKSTGREYFNMDWLDRHLRSEAPAPDPADVQSTLCAFSGGTIARAIEKFASASIEVLVCGGGAHNRKLMEFLGARLWPRTLDTTARVGIHPDWVEAAAFAWLARQTLSGAPGNLPSVTGARRPVVLGAIHPG